MHFVNCLALLLIAVPSLCLCESDGKSFVVGLLPQPVYQRANVTWPVPPPTASDLQNIKVTIKNTGEVADDVGFHTYFPDYAEMTSFTMHSEGIAYEAKKVDQALAQHVLSQARKGGHVAAVHSPKRLPDILNGQYQTAENSVHIKGNTELTFNVEYKETLQDMIDSGVKIQSRAQVVFDLFGSTVRDMVGEISSPNYPQPYPNSADIAWLIRVPDDNIVELSIVDIDIEECCDRLTIYDGNSLHGRVIASLSGSMADQNGLTQFQSSGSSMSVHLVSDCSGKGIGFKAVTSFGVISPPDPIFNVTAIPGDDATTATPYPLNNGNCSGSQYLYPDTTGEYYYLSSPNYPNNYYTNINCKWFIVSRQGFPMVSLRVLALDLEYGYDFLSIYDYNHLPLANITGSLVPADPFVSELEMSVEFITDSSVTLSGFSLQYHLAPSPYCNETVHLTAYSNEYQSIASLNYPDTYYNYLRCTWHIHSVSSDYVVEVYIADFDIDQYGDHLVFYDGPSQYYKQIAYAYRPGAYVQSTGDDLFVTFLSGFVSFLTKRGILLNYRSVYSAGQALPSYQDPSDSNAAVACNTGLYVDVDAHTYTYVNSPNYPDFYESNLTCVWYMQTTQPGHGIQLEVNDALLDYSDRVYVTEGWNDTYVSPYVYNDMFSRYLFKTPEAKVELWTDNAYNGKGYLFLVKSVPIPACLEGEELDIYSGYSYLTSPNYPDGYYNYMPCTWTIYSHNDYYIELSVIELGIALDDVIQIYDGPGVYYPFLTMLNSGTNQTQVYSSGYDMHIAFYPSLAYQPGIGFRFKYATTNTTTSDPSELQKNCSTVHHLSQLNGTITSNNYPNGYANNTNECWIFDRSYNEFNFNMHDFYTNYGDRLYLYSSETLLGVWYSNYYPHSVSTHMGYSFWLQFVADGSGTERGFTFDYEVRR